jgi:hypothetical protein
MKSVRSTFDVSALAKAVSRPGIDPRVNLALAIVGDESGVDENGVFVDVTLIPSGDLETANLGSNYVVPGGKGGSYMPVHPGDVVLVGFPSGDAGYGPVIVSRIWTKTEPAPDEVYSGQDDDPTKDPLMRVEDGRTYHIVAKEGATISLVVEGSGAINIAAKGQAAINLTGEGVVTVNSPDVRLGDSPGQPIARVGDLVVGSVRALCAAPGSPILPVPPAIPTATGGVTFTGKIVSGKVGVKA